MSKMIQAKADFKGLLNKFKRLDRELQAGMMRAENRGLSTVKRVAKEEYDKGLGIKLKREDADRRIVVVDAKSTQSGYVRIITKRMSFAAFQPKPVNVRTDMGRRIGVSIKTSSGRKLVYGFLIPDKKPVFERQGPDRGPLDVRLTNAPSRIFSSSEVVRRLRSEGLDTLSKNVVSEYQFRRQRVFGGT